MPKTRIQDTLFQMTAIQKMSDDGLVKLINDLKADIEQLEFAFTAKNLLGMGVKEDIERNSRYHLYCELLLDALKKERKNRKNQQISTNKNELK